MKRLVLSAVCALALGACATPVSYGPAISSRASGFTEQRIENDRFRVTFRGAGPAAQINDFALLRASELTLQQNFDWFRIVGRSEDIGRDSGPRMSVGTGSSSYGRRSAVGVGIGTSFDLGGGPMREVALEIKMGAGPPPPNDRDVYDARSVMNSIRSRMPPPPPR
jgi:hypothetical protein